MNLSEPTSLAQASAGPTSAAGPSPGIDQLMKVPKNGRMRARELFEKGHAKACLEAAAAVEARRVALEGQLESHTHDLRTTLTAALEQGCITPSFITECVSHMHSRIQQSVLADEHETEALHTELFHAKRELMDAKERNSINARTIFNMSAG